MKRAVFFERVSLQRQAKEGHSLDTQKAMAEDYASRHGLTIIETIVEVESGRRHDRSGVKRIEELARAKDFDVLVVYKLDRLARSLVVFYRLVGLFQEKGIEILSLTESFETSTAAGRLLMGNLAMFAGYFSDQLSERVRDSMAHIAAEGRWTGGKAPPTGYRYDAEAKQLLIDESEAPMIRELFSIYLECQSLHATAVRMNALGHRSRSGKMWNGAMVRRHLRCTWYAGLASWGKRRSVPSKKSTRKVPKEEHLVVPGQHEAIIPPETWEQVQRLMDDNAGSAWDQTGKDRPWNVVMRCAGCGRRMTAVPSKVKSTGEARDLYHCRTRYDLNQPCSGAAYPSVPFLERDVIGALSALWDEFGTKADGRRRRSPLKLVPTDNTRLITQLHERLARARELYVEGHWDRETLRAKTADIEAQIAVLAAPPAEKKHIAAAPLPQDLAARWQHMPTVDQRDVLRSTIEMILVGRKHVDVILRPRPEPGYPAALAIPIKRVFRKRPSDEKRRHFPGISEYT